MYYKLYLVKYKVMEKRLTDKDYTCKLKLKITSVILRRGIMKKLPKISDSEWEIMKIVWSKDEVTSNEIIESLSGKQQWKSTTIKSLISRLLNKEAIGFRKNGKEYVYYSLISEEECIKEESQSFLKRVFNGSLNDMILNLVKSEELTNEDINELRDILNEKLDVEDK